ncbi:MAG: class I SAM-dependent methyltransferase [Candidatus Brocadiia bacterium]|nr:MAG: class I SAM-dependent methyltransferase [Candidatus Brocadiia bacterium]
MKINGVLLAAILSAVLKLSYVGYADSNTPPVQSSIPYVATRNDAVKDMLWMANVGKEDVVYDLGSGDGRIVIAAVRDFGARQAVGIEIDPERICESRKNAQEAGVTDRVEFIQGDLFTSDFGQASVVTLFLGHEPNIKLRPKLFSILKPGSRIVSHQFAMGEWQPDKTQTVRTVSLGMWGEQWMPFSDNTHVPDYTGNEMHFGNSDKISMWIVPAPVAGIWRGKIETAQGPQDCKMILHQRLSVVTGTFQLAGQTNLTGGVRVDLWGDHVRFEGSLQLRFDGHVRDNTIQGTLSVADHGQRQPRESAWQAQRDKADFTGTWEWPCASGPRPVRLRIEQRDGHFMATYLDGDQTIPVTDFYDCGGGFYFTLLIGREKYGFKNTDDTGWLLGEGIIDDGELKGKVEFYPYRDRSKKDQPAIQEWTPRRIQP